MDNKKFEELIATFEVTIRPDLKELEYTAEEIEAMAEKIALSSTYGKVAASILD